jgi:hypothetical protein
MADRTPLARVSAIQGKAFARDQDGNLRQLHIGDVIYEGDVVVTGAGSRVDLATPDSHSLVLRANETLTVDAEVFATVKPDATDAALLGGARDVDRVIKAINEGGSLDALLDETAAGAGTPGGADGGPTFVRLLRIVENVDPLAFEFGTARTAPVDEVLGGAGSAADGLIDLIDAGLAAQSAATAAAAVGSIAAAGNPGGVADTPVAIDTVAPSVVVDIVDTRLNSGDRVSTVTFTFSDAPSGFDLADIAVVGGTLSDLTPTADPKVFTATFTAADGFTGTGSVGVTAGSYTDAAGDPGRGASDTVSIDTVAPSVVVDIVDTSLTRSDAVSVVTFTFSDAPVGFTLADTTAVGGTLSGLTPTADPKVFTATFTAAVGFTGTGSVGVTTGSYTDAAGDPGRGASDTVAIDTVAPSVVVDITDPSLNSGDKVSTVTFTFSDAPVGFTLAATTAVGGTLSGLTPTADPKVFTATFMATDAFTGTGSVAVTAGSYTNAAGSPGGGGSDTVPIDTVAPSVVVDIVDASLNSIDKVSTVTFTFSDAPVGFTLADTTAVGGTLSGLTPTADPKVFTATFTATDGFTGPGSVAVTAGSYTDAAGNPGTSGSDTVPIDTVAPSVIVDIVDPSLNSTDKVSTVTFTFSDAPVGFTLADTTAVGGTLSGLTPTADPKVFTATFAATDGFTGTGSVSVANASYTNAAGSPGGGGSDTVPIDTVAPSVVVDIVDASLNSADKVSTVTFTFSDAPVGFTLADTTAVGGTLSGLTPTADPKVFTATFTATDGFTGTGSVTVADASYTDTAGNTGSGNSDTVPIDTVAPSIVVDIVDTTLNSTDKVSTVTFTFSDAPVGFTLADTTAVGGTLSGLTPTADPKVFTATFTATDAFTGTGSVSVADASYTDAASNAGSGNSDTVPIDTVAPSVVVDIVDTTLNSTDKVSTVTFTFSDAPVGFTLADTTAVGGTLSGLTPTADPKVFTATFTATDGFTGTGSVSVANASYTDTAGNTGSGNSDTVPIDTVAPSVVVDIVDASLNSADKVSTVTFTFSDAPVGFTLADTTAVGGTLSGLTPTADPKVFTATFTATDGFTGTGSVSVANASYTNAAGSPGGGGSDTVPIDTVAPSVVVDIVDASLNSADKVSTVTFTFSDAPVGFTLADTTAVGGTLSGLTPTADPKVFTATFTATDGFTGTGSVSVANASYTNAAGSPGGGGSDTVPIDTVAPSVVVDIVDASLNSADKVSTVTFTFSDAPVGFTLADTTAVGGTLSGLTPTADPKVFTATFTATDGFTGTGSVSVANASYTNAAGSPGGGGSDTVPIDTVAPSVVVDIVDASLNSADKVSTVTFTFSDAPVGFTLADTTAVGGTLSGLTPTADPKVFTATFTATDGFTGTGSVSVANASYTNAAGSPGGGGSDTVPIDTVAPSVVVDIVDASLNSADKVSTVTFTFSDAPVGFTLADTTAVGGTLSGLTPTADPKVFTATFTATDGFTGTGSVSVADASYTNAAGSPGGGGSDTVPIDTVAPSVVVDIVDASLNSADKVSTVTFTFSDAPVGFTLADTTAVGGTLSGLTPTADPKVFTATFTATDGFTGTGSVSVANASYTNAAGSPGGGGSDTVPIDTVAPSVVVDIVDASLNSADKVSTVTFTFSDAPVGFHPGRHHGRRRYAERPDADRRPESLHRHVHSNRRLHRHRQCQRRRRQLHRCRQQRRERQQRHRPDRHRGSERRRRHYRRQPEQRRQGVDRHLHLQRRPGGLYPGRHHAVGGTLSGLTPTADPKVFTATFTATDAFTGTGSVSVADASYTDAAGNAGSGNSDTVPIDTVAPSVVVDIIDASLNSADKVSTVTFTFSDAPVGFTLADTTAVGGTLSGLTPTADPKVFTATFTATDGFTGTGSVSVADASYTDTAGNTGSGNSDTVPIDTVAPSVVVDIVDASLNSADKVSTVTFTFSDAPVGFDLADITAVGGTLSGLTVRPPTRRSSPPPSRRPTASPAPAASAFANASYTNAAGNPAVAVATPSRSTPSPRASSSTSSTPA